VKKKHKIHRLEILLLDQQKRLNKLERAMQRYSGELTELTQKVYGDPVHTKVSPIKRNRDLPGVTAIVEEVDEAVDFEGFVEEQDGLDLYRCRHNPEFKHRHPCTCTPVPEEETTA